MNNLTLEEVMDKVDSYLTEANTRDLELSKDAAKRSVSTSEDKLKGYKSRLKAAEKELKDTEKAGWAAKSKEERLKLWEKRDALKADIERIRGYILNEENALKAGKKDLAGAKKELRKANIDDFLQNNPVSSKLKKLGEDLDAKKAEKDAKTREKLIASGKLVPESAEDSEDSLLDDIVDLKIRVYEACDEGYITEADKDLMLEYLNLDNYEEVRESFQEYISR